MVWHKLPYTNFHDLNEDWITSKILELNGDVAKLYEVLDGKLDAYMQAYIDNHLAQFSIMASYNEENTSIKFYSVESEGV